MRERARARGNPIRLSLPNLNYRDLIKKFRRKIIPTIYERAICKQCHFVFIQYPSLASASLLSRTYTASTRSLYECARFKNRRCAPYNHSLTYIILTPHDVYLTYAEVAPLGILKSIPRKCCLHRADSKNTRARTDEPHRARL